MIVYTGNLGRGVNATRFRRAVLLLLRLVGIIGFQEIDEADAPNEHRILRALMWVRFRFVGFRTRVPIAVPRGRFKVVDQSVTPASPGVPRQSPARVIVEAVVRHRFRRRLPEFAVLNVHFPRNTDVLAEERAQVWAALRHAINVHMEAARSVIITADANGMFLLGLHPRARRIGGAGIDWILAVEHPWGVQFTVKDAWSVELGIDRHKGWATRVGLRRPKGKR